MIRHIITFAFVVLLLTGSSFASSTLNFETLPAGTLALDENLILPECTITPTSSPTWLAGDTTFKGEGGSITAWLSAGFGHRGSFKIDFVSPVTGLTFETKGFMSSGNKVIVSAFAGSVLLATQTVTSDRQVDFSAYSGITKLDFKDQSSSFGGGFVYGKFNFDIQDSQGFEAGALSPWLPFGNANSSISNSAVRTGGYSLTESNGIGGVYRDLSGFVPGAIYQVTAYARSSTSTSGQGQALLWVHDTLGSGGIYDGWRTPSSAGWDIFTVRFIATNNGRIRIHLFFSGGSGAVNWDDIRVTDTSGLESQILDAWSPFGSVNAAVSNSAAHRGSNSLAETGGGGGVYQDISELTPGALYRVTAYARTAVSTAGQALMWVHDTSGGGTAFDGGRTPSSTGWEVFTVTFIATNNGRMRIHLLFNGGTGTVFWDDIQVADLSGLETGHVDLWSPFGGIHVASADTVARTGVRSLAESAASGGVYLDVNGLVPGAMYQVTANAQASSSTAGQGLLWVHDTTGNGGTLDGWRTVASTGWERFTVNFLATATGSMRIHLFFSRNTGTLYWDDIHVADASGFEVGGLEPWSPFGGVHATISDAAANTGAYSLAETAGGGGVYQELSGLIPGATYHITANARSASATTGQALLLVDDTAGGGSVIDDWRTPSSTAWDIYAVTFVATANGRARIHLFFNGGSGTVYWDDIRITQ